MAALLVAFIVFVLSIISLTAWRLRVILNPKRARLVHRGLPRANRVSHLLIVLGSGGHTAEMIAMLDRAVHEEHASRRLVWNDYTYRTWIVGSGDSISIQRAKDFEELACHSSTQNDHLTNGTHTGVGNSVILNVPRARRIHQSILTTPISSVRCMIACYNILLQQAQDKGFPDLMLCNGPATATILVFTSILLRFFDIKGCETNGKMRTIYIESWARVKRLSLSGMLLSRLVDRFIVQWPQLEKRYGDRTEYLGILV